MTPVLHLTEYDAMRLFKEAMVLHLKAGGVAEALPPELDRLRVAIGRRFGLIYGVDPTKSYGWCFTRPL